jgi:ABC-type glycerol-3-phosphate transport system substrate-binding protein
MMSGKHVRHPDRIDEIAGWEGRGRRRQYLLGGGALAGAAALAACGGDAGRDAAAGFREAGPPVKLIYLQRPKSAENQPILEALLARFTAEVPRIQVETAVASDIHVVQKALQLHVAGTTADIVEWGRDGYDLRDAIIDLSPYMKRDKVSTGVFVGTSVEVLTRDGGKFMGIPASVSADGLLYNPAAFTQVNLPPPPVNPDDRSWTMEKFQEYAVKLTQRPDRFGWGGNITGGFEWMDAATYFGTGVWDDKAQKVLINTADFRSGLQYWVDLRLRYRTVPDADEARGIQGGFASGKLAMNVGFSLPAGLQFKPAIATLPFTGPGKNVSARFGNTAMFAGPTKLAEASWQLLKWLTEPTNNAQQSKANGHVVTGVIKATEIARKEFQQQSGVDPQGWFLQAARSKFVGWGIYKYPQAEIVARNEIQPRYQSELLTGKIGVNEFALFAEQKLKEAIAAGL